MQGREMLLTLAAGWRASALRAKEAGHFCKVADVSIIAVGGLHSQYKLEQQIAEWLK